MISKKFKLPIKRSLIVVLALIVLVPALVAGYTYAVVIPQGWFTDDDNDVTPGAFEMGTLIIGANHLGSDPVGPLGLDDCTTINYNITNEGSKRVYVRARFDGIWQQSFHKNTATVTAYHNGQAYTATDSAYFNYVNEVPEQLPGFNPTVVDFGFNHNIYLPPLVFPALQFPSSGPLAIGPEILSTSGSEFELQTLALDNPVKESSEGDGQLLISEEDEPGNLSMMLVAEQYEATGRGVIPEKRNFVPPWGIPLNFPSPCGELIAYKFDIDEEEESSSDSSVAFSVDFEEVDGKIDFSNASHPVIYVWVKGGTQGMLFSYDDLNGVRDDTGLYPPPNPNPDDDFYDLSHITFFYCMPTEEDNPSITIIKKVSVDGGANYYPADTPEEARTLQEGIAPKFRFVVTNTGNVTLSDVTVVDDHFGLIGSISSLEPRATDGTGGTETFDYTFTDWLTEAPLSTANVQLSLGSSNDEHWTPLGPQALGEYFYYESVLFPPSPSGTGAVQIPLNLNVCLNPELTGPEYEGAVLILYASFEAIQVTNNMDVLNWGVTIESE